MLKKYLYFICLALSLFSLSYAEENKHYRMLYEKYAKSDHLEPADDLFDYPKKSKEYKWNKKNLIDGLSGAPEFRLYLEGSITRNSLLTLEYDSTSKYYWLNYRIIRDWDSNKFDYQYQISQESAFLLYNLVEAAIHKTKKPIDQEDVLDGSTYFFIIVKNGNKAGQISTPFIKRKMNKLVDAFEEIITRMRKGKMNLYFERGFKLYLRRITNDIIGDRFYPLSMIPRIDSIRYGQSRYVMIKTLPPNKDSIWKKAMKYITIGTKTIFFTALLLLFATAFIYNYYPEKKLPIAPHKSNGADSSVALANGDHIDYILVLKSKREMIVYSNGKALKTYKVSLGKNPVGRKECEGDKKTPEGIYYINDKNPNSGYHKNLGISYPNDEDLARAKEKGLSTGGDIKIHGLRNGLGWLRKYHRWYDWTAGCIAVTDQEIDELYAAVPVGTKVEIRP